MSLCMCAASVHVHDNQQRAADPLALKLQMVVCWDPNPGPPEEQQVFSAPSRLFSPRAAILTGLGLL